ncbi:MAG: phosphate acyltransferase PlsX [Gammaproteobacteria bacterium]|nr:phosphate acyltransferase PlsX [Gammaproteobacteria bacterium]
MKKVTIAIDAMGGDYGAAVTVPAAIAVLKKHKNLRLILVGDEDFLEAQVKSHTKRSLRRLTIKHASEQVAMDELPSKALRKKKDSSMRVAINLVRDGIARACVSSGNTGALMATSRFVLKTLPGVDRPALISSLPTRIPHKGVYMLDLGANIDSCADHLYQFAIMGSVMTRALHGIKKPKVGLLNIGEEEIKGNDLVKRTAQMLSESKEINFYGYIEGNDIFKGVVDVVVCDGFIGNITLKSLEGLLKMVGSYAKKAFLGSFYGKFATIIAIPMLKKLKTNLDPNKRNGASLIGLKGVVIKSHGSANVEAFKCAIEEAMLEAENDVPRLIGDKVGKILVEESSIEQPIVR